MRTSVKLRYDAFINAYLYNGFQASKAAITAGYAKSRASQKGWELVKVSYIKEKIEEKLAERRRLEEENREKLNITVDFVQKKHVVLMDKSENDKDYANATRNLEGLGKTIGAYHEAAPIDDPAKQIDLARRTECQKLAAIRITEMLMEPDNKATQLNK